MKSKLYRIPAKRCAAATLAFTCFATTFSLAQALPKSDAARKDTGAEQSRAWANGTPEADTVPPVQLRRQQIEKAAHNGLITKLEAEFITVLSGKYETPQTRQEAISTWRNGKGKAMDKEREAERERLQPQRDVRMAAIREHRQEQIGKMRESGRIGPSEAEFMMLMHRDYVSPQVRLEAIRTWNDTKGVVLAAEREQKRDALVPLREKQTGNMHSARRQQIADAVASGRIGPLEGELQTLLVGDYPNVEERRQALRVWMGEKRDALENEKAVRADDSVQRASR